MKLRMVVIPVCLAAFLMLIATATAAKDYFVDSEFTGDSNGSRLNPWKAISDVNGFKSFEEGDDVYFKCGNPYTGRLEVDWSGSQNDDAIIGRYDCTGDDMPKLEGESEQSEVIKIDDQKFVTIKQLDIDANNEDYGIYVQNPVHHPVHPSIDTIKIIGVKLSNAKRHGAFLQRVNGGTVQGCTITESGDVRYDTTAAIFCDDSSELTIERNIIENNHHHGLRIKLKANENAHPNCSIKNNSFLRNGADGTYASNIKISKADDVLIQSNRICYENSNGPHIGLTIIDPPSLPNTGPITILGNLISNCSTGISIGNSSTEFMHFKVYNNTLKNCSCPFKLYGQSNASEVKNNIFYNGDELLSLTGGIQSGISWDYNLWFPNRPNRADIKGFNDIVGGENIFVNSNSYGCDETDFRLSAVSPAINKGVVPDIDGSVRSAYLRECINPNCSWSNWSIGADCCKFSSVLSPPTLSISEPRRLRYR